MDLMFRQLEPETDGSLSYLQDKGRLTFLGKDPTEQVCTCCKSQFSFSRYTKKWVHPKIAKEKSRFAWRKTSFKICVEVVCVVWSQAFVNGDRHEPNTGCFLCEKKQGVKNLFENFNSWVKKHFFLLLTESFEGFLVFSFSFCSSEVSSDWKRRVDV